MDYYYQDDLVTIYHGDCCDVLSKLDEKIDLTVTSPPYDELRKYHGYHLNFEDVAKSLYQITQKGGVMIWVSGDAVVKGSETGTSFKQALYFKEIGFNLHDTMIYQKHNFSKPSSNRYHQMFEYMFVLSKGAPRTFHPIMDRKNVYGGEMGSWGKNTIRQADGTFKENPRRRNTEYGKRYNIWRLITEMKPLHPAQFPEQLAGDHILSWSNEGDIILDPFAGSGTTLKMAKLNKRKSIGIDISELYCEIAAKRCQEILS